MSATADVPPGDITAALAATAAGTSWVPLRFEAAYPGATCAGEALTVELATGDNRALHRALGAAPPGHVLVVSVTGPGDAGHWGGMMTQAALNRGVAGLVIDGSIRDRDELRHLGLPVFFRSTCPVKARKEKDGRVGTPISLGGVEIATGDHVVADEDGVVAIPRAAVAAVYAEAAVIAAREAEVEADLANGRRSVE